MTGVYAIVRWFLRRILFLPCQLFSGTWKRRPASQQRAQPGRERKRYRVKHKSAIFEKGHRPILVKITFLESAHHQLSNSICRFFWAFHDLPTNRDYQGPSQLSGVLCASGTLWLSEGPSQLSDPLNIRGLPTVRPSEDQRPSNWSFKIGLTFFGLVNLGPSGKIVGQIRGLFSFGRGRYLRPLETSAPAWPSPSYVSACYVGA